MARLRLNSLGSARIIAALEAKLKSSENIRHAEKEILIKEIAKIFALEQQIADLNESLEIQADLRDQKIEKVVDLEEQVEGLKKYEKFYHNYCAAVEESLLRKADNET